MGAKEKKLINEDWKEDNKKGRMFRINAGMGWIGKKIKKQIPVHILKMLSSWMHRNGIKHKFIKILIDPRPFHGAPKGYPDKTGWESITLCKLLQKLNNWPCHDEYRCDSCSLTQKIAVFKAVECKTGKLQLTAEQKAFRNKLLEDGGIYEVKREK